MSSRMTRREAGFSLVELLVSVFIAGIVFASMVPVFVGNQKAQTRDTVRTVALAVAQDRVEKVRDLDYNRITLYTTTSWSSTATGQAKYCNNRGTLGNPSATYNLSDPDEAGDKRDLGSTGFGPIYRYQTAARYYRDLTVLYGLKLSPDWTAADGTEQYKEVTVRVIWDFGADGTADPFNDASPDDEYVELKTQVYKQFAGPVIVDFKLLQNNQSIVNDLENTLVTMAARISPADLDSMAPSGVKEGLVRFSIFNAQGTLIDQRIVKYTPRDSSDPTLFTATWDPASAPDGLYSFKAIAFNKDAFQGNSWGLSFILEKGAPSAPVVSAVGGNASVTLSWVSTPPITAGEYYTVERSTTGATGAYTQIATNLTSTTHLDSGLTNGSTYWYRVKVFDSKGNSSTSAAVSATPAAPALDTTPPTAPSGMSAAKGGPNVPTIVVTWTTVSTDNPPPSSQTGVDHYVVQRASNSAFTTDVTTLDANYPYGVSAPYNTSFPDGTAGYNKTWYYRICAVDKAVNALGQPAGNVGPWSAVVSATTDAPVVRTLSVTRANGKYYVWVQAKTPPYLWYTTGGIGSTTRPTGVVGNKNSTTTWSGLPAGLYTVVYSLASSGSPQTGAKDADLSGGNASVSI